MAIERYDELKTPGARAQQIWPILIGLAYNRQTITYGGLADALGFGGAGVFAGILGQIMNWCDANGLPPLTVLVVNTSTGLPGAGLTTLENVNADREKVFDYDWFGLVAPLSDALAAASVNVRASN